MKAKATKRVKVLRGPEWHAGWQVGRTELRSAEWVKAYNEGFSAGQFEGAKIEQETLRLQREEAHRLQDEAKLEIEAAKSEVRRFREGEYRRGRADVVEELRLALLKVST